MQPALLERCRGLAPVPTVVVHPCDASALAGPLQAAADKLIAPILVAPKAKLVEIAQLGDVDLGAAEIIDVPHSHAAAKTAVELVREGRAELLMKDCAVAMLAAHARRRR